MTTKLEYHRGTPRSVLLEEGKAHPSISSLHHDGLPPVLVEVIEELMSVLAEIRSELEKLSTALAVPDPKSPAEPKEAFSTAEVAELLGKSSFTVREWCRTGRINCSKKACGFGPYQEWLIGREEVERIRNFGLLRSRP